MFLCSFRQNNSTNLVGYFIVFCFFNFHYQEFFDVLHLNIIVYLDCTSSWCTNKFHCKNCHLLYIYAKWKFNFPFEAISHIYRNCVVPICMVQSQCVYVLYVQQWYMYIVCGEFHVKYYIDFGCCAQSEFSGFSSSRASSREKTMSVCVCV